MDEHEARSRFAAARVARLGTVDGAGNPHLVPVTFAVVSGTVVFAVDHKPKAGTDLKRLRNIRVNPAVSFLVDHYDDDWTQLWWVRADATASITDVAERGDDLRALSEKYRQYVDRPPSGTLVRATVAAWRGWTAASPANGRR